MNRPTLIKPLFWIGTSESNIRKLPAEVQDTFGFALHRAQEGAKHEKAKPIKGYKSAGILEVVESFSGNTYRAVYTVRFREAVYVLHVFQKKSKHGIATPKQELYLIEQRFKHAEEHYKDWIKRKRE